MCLAKKYRKLRYSKAESTAVFLYIFAGDSDVTFVSCNSSSVR